LYPTAVQFSRAGQNKNLKNALFFMKIRRDSSEGTVTRLRTGQSRNRRSIPGSSKRFMSSAKRPDWLWVSHRIFNGYRQPFPPKVKRPGREYHHSNSFSADVKNAWSYTLAPPIHHHGLVP